MDSAQRLEKMLVERTGTSLYDSGGHYGRHWEKNRKRDLKGEPELTLNFQQSRKGLLETVATVSLYHQLRKSLQYDHSMRCIERKLGKMLQRDDSDDGYWEVVMRVIKRSGGYISEFFNTYGSDGWVCGQNITFASAMIGRMSCWLVSIHNGCDIRGGWTDVVPFVGELSSSQRLIALGGRASAAKGQYRLDGSLVTETKFHRWESEDGGRTWWYEGNQYHTLPGLHEIPVTYDENEAPENNCCDMLVIKRGLWEEGDSLLCPMTSAPMTFFVE